MYRAIGKRVFDFIVSATALILLSPVLLVIAILVAIFLGRPVIFRQTRREFTILKFRTFFEDHSVDGADGAVTRGPTVSISSLTHQFHIGRWILRNAEYQELQRELQRRRAAQGLDVATGDFFPTYRFAPEPAPSPEL